MAIQGGLADLPVLIPCGVQFVIGGVLEPEQGVVGAGHSQQDLIELALGRPLVARLGVLDDEDHGERERGHEGLEDGSHRAGNLAAMLTAIHTAAAVTTSTAVSGRDACRSTLDSHRLI
jgi:hypothetical protein